MASDIGMTCPACACARSHPAHAVVDALQADDLDAALSRGLLEAAPCPACDTTCKARLIEARDARRIALAARDRYRARGARLQRRKGEREAARSPPPAVAAAPAPALPTAAADALARALAKAGERQVR
jgi:hypothetical protein